MELTIKYKIKIFKIFYLILLLNVILNTSELTCDKIAILPNDFENIIPNYQYLPKVHLFNYFFLTESNTKSNENEKELILKIQISNPSIFKIQVTTFHSRLKVSFNDISFNVNSNIPSDYSNFDLNNLINGEIIIKFSNIIFEQDSMSLEMKKTMSSDSFCNEPYMLLEIAFENKDHYNKRLNNIYQENKILNDLTNEYYNVFEELKNAEIKKKGKDLLVQKTKRSISPFKLNVQYPNNEYLNLYNITVYNSFDLNVPINDNIDISNDLNKTNDISILTKYFLKFQMFSEFLIAGSLRFLIIKKNEKENLKNLICLHNNKCIISERKSKNFILLETILTPGDYIILIIDINSQSTIQYYKMNYIPVSLGIKVKYMKKTQNRFNCNGKRLPITFDSLFNKNKNYFEYKGNIIFNLKVLYDELYISIPNEDNYILRLNTYYADGNNIDIKVYEILNNDINNKTLYLQSSFWGGQSSIITSLLKGRKYLINFDYTSSFFTQNERKNCEIYYLKLAFGSINYLKSLNDIPFFKKESCNDYYKKSTKDTIKEFMNTFSKEHSLISNYKNSQYEIISNNMISYNDIDKSLFIESIQDFNIIYSDSFIINSDINFYLETISDYIFGSIIPIIIPIYQNKNFNLSNEYFRKFLLHKSSINLRLTKGNYQLILVHSLNQFTYSNSEKNFLGNSIFYNDLIPKCVPFKLRIISIILDSNNRKKWECNFINYHNIPKEIELKEQQDKFYYFNHHVLIPIDRNKFDIKIPNNKKFILKVRIQFEDYSDINSMSFSLKKNGLTLIRGKKEISEEGEKSTTYYLYYLLNSNIKYELHFSNKYLDYGKFFDKCRLFTLEITINNIDYIKSDSCINLIPNKENIIYNRLIDEDNSLSKYKEDSLFYFFQKKEMNNNGEIILNQYDINSTLTSLNSLFQFKFDSINSKDMYFTYDFEIQFDIARITLLLETPFALPINLFAKIYLIEQGEKFGYSSFYNFENENLKKIQVYELLANQDMEDENILSIRGLLLSYGKYKVKFGINLNFIDKKILDILSNNLCVSFTGKIIIENKSYSSNIKGIFSKNENCPFIEIPKKLSYPGFISKDTLFTMNNMQRFKIKSSKILREFIIEEKSFFKFYIPDEDNFGYYNKINLIREKNNEMEIISSKNGKHKNFFVNVLDKGKYFIEVNFNLNEYKNYQNENAEYEHLCYYFDVYISVIPINEIYNINDLNNENNCEQKGLEILNNIQKDINFKYQKIQFLNSLSSNKLDKENDYKLIKVMKIKPNEIGMTKFEFELIYNSYIDPLYTFIPYKIINGKRIQVQSQIIKNENMIWINLNILKNTEYEIDFISRSYYPNFPICSNVIISYNYYNILAEKQETRKINCENSDKLPNYLFMTRNKEENDILKKYGKLQDKITGEMYLYGNFLLPKITHSLRTEFMIIQDSIIFIQVNPNYKINSNNIFIAIYYKDLTYYKFSQSDYNGLIIAQISNKDTFNYLTEEEEKNKVSTLHYNLDIMFDKTLTKCESFNLFFSITPKKTYKEMYVNCRDKDEDLYSKNIIPNYIEVTKTKSYQYSSYTKENKGFIINPETLNLYKDIKIILKQASNVDITLKYVHSDNLMDVSLNDNLNLYILGIETVDKNHQNGIWINKKINVNLKEGEYNIKLTFHKIFTNYLEKIFSKEEMENICNGFDIDITFTILNLKNIKISDNDFDNKDSEIKKLGIEDLNSNSIISLNPSNMNNLRLGNNLDLNLQFSYDYIESSFQLIEMEKMIYLKEYEDSTGNSYGENIYPSYINNFHSNSITYTFELNNKFSPKKCYKLYFDNSKISDNQLNDLIISKENHIYCIMSCICNPNSLFLCSLNGKCKCKFPYKGIFCNECEEGYTLTNDNFCISNILKNLKCNDDETCSGNGYCKIENSIFDPYDINIQNPCICNNGFKTKNGIPTINFCNSCIDKNKYYPYCYDNSNIDLNNNNEEILNSIKFNWDTSCLDFIRAPILSDKLFKYQKIDGSIVFNQIFKVDKNIEYSELIINENSIIRIMFITQKNNRGKVELFYNKNDKSSIIQTEGKEKIESFIMRLKMREQPYILKITHLNLGYSCNRYQLKIEIEPLITIKSNLQCENNVPLFNTQLNLYNDEITLNGDDNFNIINEKKFIIRGSEILSKENLEKKIFYNTNTITNSKYIKKGKISIGRINEPFEYNILLNVEKEITFNAFSHYKFISNDISFKIINITNNNNSIIANGNWIINEISNEENENDFNLNSGISILLTPGKYYLTITQNILSNQLLQLLYTTNHTNIISDMCFSFNLNFQSILVKRTYDGYNYSDYENKIIMIEPSMKSSQKINQKLILMIYFQKEINKILITTSELNKNTLPLNHSFYLQNTINENKIIYPSNIILIKDKFQITFKENSLDFNMCYILKFNLKRFQTLNNKTIQLKSDEPTIHRYCTKTCECNKNMNTEYNCDPFNIKKCICKKPYKGENCFDCIDGYFMYKGKCISNENCDKNYCNQHGKCYKDNLYENNNNNDYYLSNVKCLCYNDFIGEKCDKCRNNKMKFPNCERNILNNEKRKRNQFLNIDKINQINRYDNDCEFQFIPNSLDKMGYLHLDGNMHISGKYSIKNIQGKNHIMKFTLKSISHFKIFIEQSKENFNVVIYLLDKDKNILLNSKILKGPNGYDTISLIDFIADQGEYYLIFAIKNLISGGNIKNDDLFNDFSEDNSCKNIFLEMQLNEISREIETSNSLINKFKNKCNDINEEINNKPLIPININYYDEKSNFYNEINKGFNGNYIHIRKDENDINYFHYEYLYIPDISNGEFNIELNINSKFLHSQIGILLEIVEINENLQKKFDDLKKQKILSSKKINELFSNSQIKNPICSIYCFSGNKKFNSYILNRILPKDTLFRIWFYDVNPKPNILDNAKFYKYNKINCLIYQVTMRLTNEKKNNNLNEIISDPSNSLCESNELPNDLNNKDYLGDFNYFKKSHFHILDLFRIDRIKNNIHFIYFNITESYLFRFLMIPGRVNVDLVLFKMTKGEKNIVVKSNNLNKELVLISEIPRGSYFIQFKFYPPSFGFDKCESVKIEFSMINYDTLRSNINNMNFRYKKFDKNGIPINIKNLYFMNHLKKTIGDLYNKPLDDITYIIPMNEPIVIEEKNNLEPINQLITYKNITFVIDEKDNKKLKIIGYIQSDFSLIDASIYLIYYKTGDLKGEIIYNPTHKKNYNTIITHRLQSGRYTLSIKYYRKIHFISISIDEKIEIKYAEIHFDIQFINVSNDLLNLLTSEGYIKLNPYSSNAKLSNNYICRKFGISVPKTFESLRYLLFNSETHIIDEYIIPITGEGEDRIKFKLMRYNREIFRIYVESSIVKIKVILYKQKINTKENYKLVTFSNNYQYNFATLMEILDDKYNYMIIIKYEGYFDLRSSISQEINKNKCISFKMEIAFEKNNIYNCPKNNNKYIELTNLKPLPQILPVKYENKNLFFKYDSSLQYKGENKESGYVYLLRKDNDTYIKYQEFLVYKPIDFKFEIINNFLISPVTIILKDSNTDSIISYGNLFDGRSVLLIKNLPKGSYSLELFIPKQKTSFKENLICSLYDIKIESKKSSNHYKIKELINKIEIINDNLDIPVRLPYTLNEPKYMIAYGENSYINYINNYYMRYNSTYKNGLNNIYLINTIPFTLEFQSVCNFNIELENSDIDNVQIAIDNISNFSNSQNKLLNKGNYTLIVKLNRTIEKGNLKPFYDNELLSKIIRLYIGISPLYRIDQVYKYNNIISTYHQCETNYLPLIIETDINSNEFRYINPKFTINRNDIKSKIISNTTLILKNSNKNRVIAEIGSDYVFYKLMLNLIVNNRRTYYMKINNNVGFLDLLLPKGNYTLQLILDEEIILSQSQMSCLLMDVNIHIIELDKNIITKGKILGEDEITQNYYYNTKKCDGNIIPISISSNKNIDKNGYYILHLPNALYFKNIQKSKYKKNINEIDIHVDYNSIMLISTYVIQPSEFSIIPKLRYNIIQSNIKKIGYKNPKLSLINKDLTDRNTYYHLEKNTKTIQYYTLELSTMKDSINEKICPKYDIDILIEDIDKLYNKYKCQVKNNKIITLKKPKTNIGIISDISYLEQLNYTMLTEKEYSTKSNSKGILSYKIDFTLSPGEYFNNNLTTYHILIDLGFDHLISNFQILLLKGNKIIKKSSPFFNYKKNVLFKNHILLESIISNSENQESKEIFDDYSIYIIENAFHNITNVLKATTNEKNINNIPLCLPFSYTFIINIKNSKFEFPEIISIYPPGNEIYKINGQDLNIKVSFSKSPYNRKKEPITMMFNRDDIKNAFYIRKITNETKNLTFTFSWEEDLYNKNEKINPYKVISANDNNNKEWYLIFKNEIFEDNSIYEFRLIEFIIYDNSHYYFQDNKGIFKEKIYIKTGKNTKNFDDNPIENEKDLSINNIVSLLITEQNEKEIIDESEDIKNINIIESYQNCNGHGKYIFDNMINRHICSCYDGFSGKFCDYCEGRIIDNKCVDDDNSNDYLIDNNNINNNKNINEDYKIIDCEKCFNGICDNKIGKCICDIGWIGKYCDELIKKVEDNKIIINKGWDLDKYKNYIFENSKLFIGIILFYIYRLINRSNKNKNLEYNVLKQNEEEMMIQNSINEDNNKLELLPND